MESNELEEVLAPFGYPQSHFSMRVEAKGSFYIGEPMRQQKHLVILGYRVEFDKVSRQRIHQKIPLERLKKSKYSQPGFLTLNIKK